MLIWMARGCYRFEENFLIMFIIGGSEGSAGAGELDDEDEEEDDHVEEEHDLVVLHGANQTHDRDEEKEDSTGGDATNDRKTCDVANHFTLVTKRSVSF